MSETKIFKKISESRRSEVNEPRRICENKVKMNAGAMGYEVNGWGSKWCFSMSFITNSV